MKRMFLLSALGLAFVIASATYVSAGLFGDYSLQGEYSLVGWRSCVHSPLGFSPDLYLILQGNGSTRTEHRKGVLRLKRNGTGEFDFKSVQIVHQPQYLGGGSQPAVAWEGSCGGVNYQRLPDGTYEVRFLNCNAVILAGRGYPGTTGVYEYVMSMEVSAFGNILLLSGTEPNVETTWYQPDGGVRSETPRICTRTSIAPRRW